MNEISTAVHEMATLCELSSINSRHNLKTLLEGFVTAVDCPEQRMVRLHVVRCSSFIEDCGTHNIAIKVPSAGYCESRWDFNECSLDAARICVEENPDTVEGREPENTWLNLDLNERTA